MEKNPEMSDSDEQEATSESPDALQQGSTPKPSTNEVEYEQQNSSSSIMKRFFRRCNLLKCSSLDRISQPVDCRTTTAGTAEPMPLPSPQQQQHQQQQQVASALQMESALASHSNYQGVGELAINDCITELTEPVTSNNSDPEGSRRPQQLGKDDDQLDEAPKPEEKNSNDGQPSVAKMPDRKKTKEQIFRANEFAARKRAESLWTVDASEYNFGEALKHYTYVDKFIKPRAMKYIVDHREKQLCDDFGKVMRTVTRGAIHPMIDKVVSGFCQRLGMSEAQKVPTVEERMFLWFSRDRALKLMNRMGPKSQVYFLNFIPWDHILTDLQCLNSRLRHCSPAEGQAFGDHYCSDPEKIREVFNNRFDCKPDTELPKMLFVDRQYMCSHVYSSQEFNVACQEKDCPNYGKRMCKCFQMTVFLPETMVLATKTHFERVIKNFLDEKYFSQRWLIRASNLKAGNGVQFIDSAAELETFLRYDIRRRLRGQFFIMQRYLKNPMLMGMHRFDCRMFLLVCVLTDRRVLGFLHPGYVRLAQKEYDSTSNDLRCHITLPFTWEPDYNRYNVKDPASLPDYCHSFVDVCESLNLPKLNYQSFDDDLRSGDHFISKMNCIVQEIVRSVESIIFEKPGTWQLFGLDLSIDNDKNPWLYDVMTYPCPGEPDFFSDTQNRVVPAVIAEALTIVFELNQRDGATRSRLEWMDLPDIPWNKPGLITAQKNFVWMYSTSPERLVSYKEEYKIQRLHWYHQWRVTEDFNDYILYLKNFRIDNLVRAPDTNIYGRKTFDNSPVFKLKQQLKKSGFKALQNEAQDQNQTSQSQSQTQTQTQTQSQTH